MIEFAKGDMFAFDVEARVNTVNCEGVMGKGVALAFKVRYPEMFLDYELACKEGRLRPGQLHVWKNLLDDWVINFPTKDQWRNRSRYEYIQSGLVALRDYLILHRVKSITLPALGCGHGKLVWSRVSDMIIQSLSDLETHIFVFRPTDSREMGEHVFNPPKGRTGFLKWS